MIRGLGFRLPLALALLLAPAAPAAAYDVKEIGSYYLGGHMVHVEGLPKQEVQFSTGAPVASYDPNGDVETGQMYVQVVRLTAPLATLPLVFFAGAGFSGSVWESTPDGRPGWQQYFLAHGFDTIVPDAVGRGRSTWSRWPQIYSAAPLFRTAQEGWALFRIGPHYDSNPAKRQAWPGEQFPVQAWDNLVKQFDPRWTTIDGPTQDAYNALVQRECPCILIAHSQGAAFAIAAAVRAPDRVRASVGLEPRFTPDPAKLDTAKLKGIPMLFIWGDNIDKDPAWENRLANPQKFEAAMRAQGNRFDWVSLPERGIHGNSHMLMMDRNSEQIADIVRDWLAQQGFVH